MNRPHFGFRDVAAALVLCGLAAAALVPAVARSRESTRRHQCTDNLRAIGVALRQYHDVHGALPPAAVWEPGTLSTLLLYEMKRFDRTVHENWAQLLLPYLGQHGLAARFDRRQPIMASGNQLARETQVAELACPSDGFNGPHNLYGFQPWDDRPPLATFARGNYAINGGSHSIRYQAQSAMQPQGESMQVVLDHDRRRFEAVGTGVAGINHSFRLADFINGQASLAAVDEVRAGVHSLDMRGVWALGHIGSSITWAHGVVGDAGGPNNQWDRSDDIFDCGRIHKALGSDRLAELRMPCCSYIDLSEEATARSQHPGGVHVLFLDGAARFVSDEVDRGIWHVMHSRETPRAVLEDLDAALVANAALVGEANRPLKAEGGRQNAEDQKAEGRGQKAEKIGDPPPNSKSEIANPKWAGRPLPEREGDNGAGFLASSMDGWTTGTVILRESRETLENSLGMRFVAVPAGTFTMGIPDVGNDGAVPPECPPHEVEISAAFWMGMHEVTQRQYQSVMGKNPSHHSPEAADTQSTDDFPVENVTWYEADEFCRRLGEAPEEHAAGRSYRLPNEAEWEYACRSGKSEPYHWRANRRADDKSGEAAGISPPLPLAKVGSYPPNAFGLYDMRGNVWEWCADWFDRSYYSRSPQIDPQGPARGYLKVVRGGDWIFVGEVCHINYPIMPPWKRSPFVGFRVVCECKK